MEKDRALYLSYLKTVEDCARYIQETLRDEDKHLYDNERERLDEFKGIKKKMLATMQTLVPYLQD